MSITTTKTMKLKYNAHKARYIVSVITEGPYLSSNTDTLNYEIEINPLEKHQGYDHVEVHKTKQFLNYQRNSDSSGHIMSRAAETAEKLNLKIDTTGKVLELLNFEDLKVKWYQIRSELEELYQNNDLIKHIDHVHSQINNSSLAWQIISKGIFFTLFFLELYKDYEVPNIKDQFIDLYDLLPEQSVRLKYTSQFKNDTLYLEGKDTSVKISEANIKRFGLMDSQEELLAQAKIKASYRFNPQNHIIEFVSATIDCTIKDIYHKKILVDISNINE